jgi:hypothetical protein
MICPARSPNFPLGQLIQAPIDKVEYVPTVHAVQMLAPTREPVFVIEPAAHSEQLLANAEPGVSTYVPATQPMQDVAKFDAVEYCPTAQAVQVVAPSLLPLSVIEPAGQTVHDGTFDAFEYSPAAHSSHELAPVAVPVSVREPAKQTSQYDCAPSAWKLPTWHSIHLVWFACD